MSHIWMSHVSHMNESCLTHEWVMSHIWMSHVSHMNESCLTYESHVSRCRRRSKRRLWRCRKQRATAFWITRLPNKSWKTLSAKCYCPGRWDVSEWVIHWGEMWMNEWLIDMSPEWMTHSFILALTSLTSIYMCQARLMMWGEMSMNECNTLLHTATHCYTLQHTGRWDVNEWVVGHGIDLSNILTNHHESCLTHVYVRDTSWVLPDSNIYMC